MNKKLFGELVESMTQMGQIVRGEHKPSREFHVNSDMVKKLRAASGLSQPKFAGSAARRCGDTPQLGTRNSAARRASKGATHSDQE